MQVASRRAELLPLRGGVPLGVGGGFLILLLVASTGCAARASTPPSAGYERGGIPELRGERVLLLPLQVRAGGHPDLDRELEFALRQGGDRVDWIWPEATREILRRSPGVGIRIDDLPVRGFMVGELQRVGDPLFGDLYRLGALTSAPWALLPVEARGRAEADGTETVEIAAALLDTRTGRVVWFGIVAGSPGAVGSLPASSSAAEALARRVAG